MADGANQQQIHICEFMNSNVGMTSKRHRYTTTHTLYLAGRAEMKF
jgi:hypothetical protein